jgi:hypothetical protein
MKPIIALTVSTKYDDILNIILPHDIKYFKKWYIVTHKDDEKTIQVIQKYNYDNVQILFFDFYGNNTKFNKGGAVEYGQQMIDQLEEDKDFNMLLLDSDILLPDNFVQLFETLPIEDRILYGAEVRNEYYTLNSFNNKHIDKHVVEKSFILGYFQLYKYNPIYKYSNSSDCSECDLKFTNLFSKQIHVTGLTVDHLGKPGENWLGRLKADEFA